MHTQASSVKALFSKPIRYEIPLFQRPYVWSQERQWEPLWEDVTRLADLLLQALEGGESRTVAESRVPAHFMGAVVLAPVTHGAVEVERRQVIDGQQRMTTLQLMLAAVATAAAERGHAKNAARLRRLTDNDDDLIDSAEQVNKVWPTSEDRAAYQAAMAGTPGEARLQQALGWFATEAGLWLDDAVDSGVVAHDAVWALHTATTSRLQVVVIDLEADDDPQVIFETLNARGTPLSAGDLCKNLLLQRVELRGGDVKAFYDAWWSAFDSDERWRGTVTVGREKRPRIDVLLDYWLEKRLAKPVSVHHLFAEFRTLVDASDDLNGLAADLVADGKLWLALTDDGIDGFGAEVARWRRLPAATTTPLMLWLLARREEVGAAQVRRAWSAIESFLIRRALLNLTTKDYNRLFCDLLRDVRRDHADDPGAGVEQWLASQDAPVRRWPDDEEILQGQHRRMYGVVNGRTLTLILVELENQMRPAMVEEPLSIDSKVTLEHVMPRKWRVDDWPFSDDPKLAKMQEDWRGELIDSLGNLTIVTGSLNSSLSNGSWANKRVGLEKGSVLHLNRELLDLDGFDAFRIHHRCSQMMERVVGRWSRPAASQ